MKLLEDLLWEHRANILIELNNSEKSVYEAITYDFGKDYVTPREDDTREFKARLKKMDRIIRYAYKIMGKK